MLNIGHLKIWEEGKAFNLDSLLKANHLKSAINILKSLLVFPFLFDVQIIFFPSFENIGNELKPFEYVILSKFFPSISILYNSKLKLFGAWRFDEKIMNFSDG
jgi:hypothetical protein